MNRDVAAVRDVLSGHPPTQDQDPQLQARRDATLRMVLADRVPAQQQRSSATRRRSAWLVTVGLLAALTAVTMTQLGPTGASPASAAPATPRPLAYTAVPTTAAASLQDLATSVRALPTPDAARGDITYTKTSGWYLNTRIDGELVTSVVLPEVRETWSRSDGSGRIRVAPGTPSFPSPQAEREWATDAPSLRTRDERVGAGELALMYPESLPSDLPRAAVRAGSRPPGRERALRDPRRRRGPLQGTASRAGCPGKHPGHRGEPARTRAPRRDRRSRGTARDRCRDRERR